MELKINLDMDKIDYDRINDEIVKQIQNSNILHEYEIQSRCNTIIQNMAHKTLDEYFTYRYGKPEMSYDFKNKFKEVLKEVVGEIIRENKEGSLLDLKHEDIDKLVEPILPSIILGLTVDILRDGLRDTIYKEEAIRTTECLGIIERKIDEMRN